MTVGAIATASLSALFESDRITTWTTPTVLALLYLAVFGSAVTFGLYFWLLAKYPVRNMALIAYGTPVVAVIIGGLLGEPFTLRMAVGAVLVVGGVAWALSKR
jgi:drug/metabolite transporter (DMT)-like permease